MVAVDGGGMDDTRRRDEGLRRLSVLTTAVALAAVAGTGVAVAAVRAASAAPASDTSTSTDSGSSAGSPRDTVQPPETVPRQGDGQSHATTGGS